MVFFIKNFFLFIFLTLSYSFENKNNLYYEYNITFHKYEPLFHSRPILDSLNFYNPTIKFGLGTPKQYFEISVDTTTSYAWFVSNNLNNYFNNTFNYNASSTNLYIQVINTVLLEGCILTGVFMKDIPSPFLTENEIEKKFVFGLMKDTNLKNKIIYKDGNLGLMRDVPNNNRRGNESMSYMEYLIDNKAINKQIFSIEYYDNYTGGKIIFGEKYNNNNNKTYKINYCENSLNKDYNNFWVCHLNYIIYNNLKLYAIDTEQILFDSLNPFIISPRESGTFLLKNMLKNNENFCEIVQEESYSFLKCLNNFDYLNYIYPIKLNIGETNIVLFPKNLFINYKNEFYICLLIVDDNENENWNLGIPAFLNNIFIFNQEIKKFGILEPNQIYYNLYYLLSFIIIILIILIILMIIRRKHIIDNLPKNIDIDFEITSNKENLL